MQLVVSFFTPFFVDRMAILLNKKGQSGTKTHIFESAKSAPPQRMTETAIASLILSFFVGYSWKTATPQSKFTSRFNCVSG